MADGNSENPFKPSRRDFLKFTGAAALKLALPPTPVAKAPSQSERTSVAIQSVPSPQENKQKTLERFQLGEYVERDPIPFPSWAVPSFEPLWPYMDEIGKVFGVDPRIIMGYMAMESKGNMFAESKRGAVGVMQIVPGQSTSEGWHNYLVHEPRYHEIVDRLRKIGIEIADTNYNPYKIVIDKDRVGEEGENNLFGIFQLALAAYKIARDQQSYHEFSDAERKFIAHLPDNPHDTQNSSVFEKVSNAQKRIVVFYLGDSNSLYTDSIIGHMAPFNNDSATRSDQPLSPELMNLYRGTLYAAGRENGMDGSFEDIVASQSSVAMAQNALVKAHPEWGAPEMKIPNFADMRSKWNQVQKTYHLLKN